MENEITNELIIRETKGEIINKFVLHHMDDFFEEDLEKIRATLESSDEEVVYSIAELQFMDVLNYDINNNIDYTLFKRVLVSTHTATANEWKFHTYTLSTDKLKKLNFKWFTKCAETLRISIDDTNI